MLGENLAWLGGSGRSCGKGELMRGHIHPKAKGYGEVKGKANDIMCVCSVPTQYPDIKYFSNRP